MDPELLGSLEGVIGELLNRKRHLDKVRNFGRNLRRLSPDEVELLGGFASYLESGLGYGGDTREEALLRAFNRADTDKSGVIEREEWISVCTKHFNLGEAYAAQVFDLLDRDAGGHVNLAEFEACCISGQVKSKTLQLLGTQQGFQKWGTMRLADSRMARSSIAKRSGTKGVGVSSDRSAKSRGSVASTGRASVSGAAPA